MTETSCTVESPVGRLRLVATEAGLARLEFAPRARKRPVPRGAAGVVLRSVARQLKEYFEGKRRDFELPLDPGGAGFHRTVWDQLARIGFGETICYAELARRAGRPTAVRAAGAANGRNPLSIVLPCHRVVGRDGRLRGYGGGLRAKAWLLTHEGVGVERGRVIGGP